MPLTANSIVFRLLIAVVVLAPLPLGANRPLAWTALAVAVGLLLCVWTVSILLGKGHAPVPVRRLAPVGLLFGGAMMWAAIQGLPGPPEAWQHPLWTEAAAALSRGVDGGVAATGRIALDPGRVGTALLQMLAYAGIFFLAVQLGRDRGRAREALVAVTVAGVLYAVYGLIVHFSGAERILWLEKWAYLGDVTATFVNRNAYGAYAGIGLICCTALFLQGLAIRRDERRAYQIAESVLIRSLPFLAAGLLVAMALLLSRSRGALGATGVGLISLCVALGAARILRPKVTIAAICGLVLAGLTTFTLGGEGVVDRIALQGVTDETRADLYRIALAAIGDAPLTGHGFGGFASTFSVYRDTSFPMPELFLQAHNLHLELALDLGLVAAALLYGAVGWTLATCVSGLSRRRRDQIYPAVALAAAVLLGLHGLIDFSLQMPAIAATFALLLGLGFTQSFPTARKGEETG